MSDGNKDILYHNVIVLSMTVITLDYRHLCWFAGRKERSDLEVKIKKKPSLTDRTR